MEGLIRDLKLQAEDRWSARHAGVMSDQRRREMVRWEVLKRAFDLGGREYQREAQRQLDQEED